MNEREPTIQQLFDLSGKTALVTGGTGWLGSAFCRALAEAGCRVVVSSREQERAVVAAQELPTNNPSHLGVQLDHMDDQSIKQGFESAVGQAGEIDILVNNGLEGIGKDLTNVTFKEFSRHQVNNAGYFELARHVHDHAVTTSRPASIVLIGSMYGIVGSYPDAYKDVCPASPVAYHTLKGGTVHMTRHLASYWARDQVRVNCLSPGPFPNPHAPSDMVKRLEQKTPLKRMGLPYELKGALLLLASDAGSYITGQNLLVDGGWTAW